MTAPEADFKKKVCAGVSTIQEGNDRYRVFTPFRFADGDHLSPVLKRGAVGWVISDEGNTFMRLSYKFDEQQLRSEQRQGIIDGALASFGVENRDGVLTTPVVGNEFGDALFSHIQATLRVSDLEHWIRSTAKATFMKDLADIVQAAVPADAVVTDWHDPIRDPKGNYPVDFRIGRNGRPLFLFGVNSDQKCATVAVVVMKYEASKVPFVAAAVFQDQEELSRKPVARLTDVMGKQFSSLAGNRETLTAYLAEHAGHETPA